MNDQYIWSATLNNGINVFATQVPHEVVGSIVDFGGSVWAFVRTDSVECHGCSVVVDASRNVYIVVGGSGEAVAIGRNTTAVARDGVMVGGNVNGSIITGNNRFGNW